MVKKVKHFRYDVNRKNLNRTKKKQPKVQDNILKASWNNEKSIHQNLSEMGLVFDANKIMTLDGQLKPAKEATEIVQALENKSKSVGPKKQLILSEPDRKLCVHFLSTYGEDLKKMVKDDENIYQLSAGQIGQMLKKFKLTRHYTEYLSSVSA